MLTFCSIMASERRSTAPAIVVQLLLGMALFGSATPLSKLIGQQFSVFTASCLRMLIACLVLAPFTWLLTKRFGNAQRSDWWVIVAISLFGMVGFTAAMLFGMRLTTGVIGSTIMSATPAVTAAAAVVFFGAAMNWRTSGALALAVAGIVMINLLRTGGSGVSIGAQTGTGIGVQKGTTGLMRAHALAGRRRA